MGKIKYISKIREFLKQSPVADINSLKRFISKKDKDYIYLLINSLLKKKEINKITRGFYSVYDDPSLIVFCFKPSYLGLQNALSFHNLWEQETNPIIITSRNIRTGLRKVFERNVIVKRIDKKYIFGFEYYKDGDFYFPYSDIEKTFIDMVYFNENLSEKVVKNIKRRINRNKLKKYLSIYPENINKKVSHFLLSN